MRHLFKPALLRTKWTFPSSQVSAPASFCNGRSSGGLRIGLLMEPRDPRAGFRGNAPMPCCDSLWRCPRLWESTSFPFGNGIVFTSSFLEERTCSRYSIRPLYAGHRPAAFFRLCSSPVDLWSCGYRRSATPRHLPLVICFCCEEGWNLHFRSKMIFHVRAFTHDKASVRFGLVLDILPDGVFEIRNRLSPHSRSGSTAVLSTASASRWITPRTAFYR